MVPEAGPDPLRYGPHEPAVGRIEPALSHKVLRQLGACNRPFGLAQRAQHEPDDLALVSGVPERQRLRADLFQRDIRIEQAQGCVDRVEVDQKLPGHRLVMLKLARDLGAFLDQSGDDVR